MFVVGVVKYGERVWALQYASRSASSNYRSLSLGRYPIPWAWRLLAVPKDILKVPLPYYSLGFLFREHKGDSWIDRKFHLPEEQAYEVAEVQVSLMHDIFYTKAESQFGCIRIASSLATAVALSLLFPLLSSCGASDGCYHRADVVITYVLSVGAAVLETMSSFNWYRYERKIVVADVAGIKSSTINWFLDRMGRCVITSVRRLVHAVDQRGRHGWSRSVGQHNLLQVCARSKASRIGSKMARRMGVEDWWNMLVSSSSIPISPLIQELVLKQVLESRNVSQTSANHILNSPGRASLKRKSQQLYDDLHWSAGLNDDDNNDELSLEEIILAWHIATDLYLRWYKKNQPEATSGSCKQQGELAEAVEALSNYMLFLVAVRPHMLPPPANRSAYVEMCYLLTSLDYITQLKTWQTHYGDSGLH
ncbi:hypothetical protein EJB05_14888, partial [Eragrostis curvula]